MSSEKKDEMKSVGRRGFLRGASALGAGAAIGSALLPGCDDSSTPASQVEWDEAWDVVIVGGGGAGLVAALSAIEHGAEDVLILEKGSELGGTTAVSGGQIQAAGTSFQSAMVSGDTPERHLEYYLQAAEGVADEDLLRTLTENAQAAVDFMVSKGLTYVGVYGVSPIPTVDADLMVPRIHIPSAGGEDALQGGAAHVSVLKDAAEADGVETYLEAPVLGLVKDENEGVVGVKAMVGGVESFLQARLGVVLATGGFDRNQAMNKEFSPQQMWELETGVCYCVPENQGDGIKLGISVGAGLSGLGGTIGYPGATMGTAEEIGGIWVNRQGQRFCNEEGHYAYKMLHVFGQERHQAWAVFDQSVADVGGEALGGIFGGWSADLSAEIASGLISRAETLEDLAAALDMNAAQLARTVASWNEDVGEGADPLFGRTLALRPLETGPFYAVPVTSVNLGSCGGLKIDTSCRVLDMEGAAIPRLYAAGMAAGGFIGPYYPGSGTAVLSTVVFGRIAGEQVAGMLPQEGSV
ncbi:MAG TPA: FAD-dependent oxidoreductase [Polyangiaceae bacterium LLY-WYZ-15_(1-7)]|nr:FAD-dependent oxidoreductase [Polyangiaceae bacterium LLY-WYZ-15_(1-7)]HJL06430.1 FAD-dependent oxidoreductase [Polyangiaceae bacterium LLY-WYZ-15_(1-7)]HJL09916.1 FAD-dependent oxidoreductase [Polyangiaceae bacterium LLY-WYZ-15_(1-7)]HJL21870.1 FAD-dependent oxidoreductase [Polyangiaceae bacterium LLY-WYZ-15_(1-7)]HJL32546.1 FAD-dependent oxidoreductase [Polyangiaceae bacterium LLY-WYZ-15_(1-7)]